MLARATAWLKNIPADQIDCKVNTTSLIDQEISTNSKDTETCRQPAGKFIPVIDRGRCEGKEDCIAACPFEVFEMGILGAAEKSALPFLSRVRAALHGNRQAFAVRAGACEACGLCVIACPEDAIKLVRSEAC